MILPVEGATARKPALPNILHVRHWQIRVKINARQTFKKRKQQVS